MTCKIALLTALEIRRTQLGQLSFARRKLQTAQQVGNTSAVMSLSSKLVLMRDAFILPADSPVAVVLLSPLISCVLPAALEQRRAAVLAAAGKLEAAFSEMKSKP